MEDQFIPEWAKQQPPILPPRGSQPQFSAPQQPTRPMPPGYVQAGQQPAGQPQAGQAQAQIPLEYWLQQNPNFCGTFSCCPNRVNQYHRCNRYCLRYRQPGQKLMIQPLPPVNPNQ